MSCKNFPPTPNTTCLDCWACGWPPGANKGVCSSVQSVGPTKTSSTCEATGLHLTTTKEECEKKCDKPWTGATCYQCTIGANEANGTCRRVYPINPDRTPATKCPNINSVFTTLEKCKKACVHKGPVKPVANCWSHGDSSGPNCHCAYGQAYGPDGPYPSCLSSQGNYDTEAECKESCIHKKKKKDFKWLWIGLGIGGGLLLLIIIIIVIIYFYKR